MKDWVCAEQIKADRVSQHLGAASSSCLDSLDDWAPFGER